MTQFEGKGPDNSPTSHAGSDDSVSSLEPTLDPQSEAELREILADLPPIKMPDAVFDRIQAAIAAEPHPSAGQSNVTTLHARRNRAFLAIAGVAAAGVIGMYVGSTLMQEAEDSNPTLASVAAPMTMSDTVYQGGALANQVSAKLSGWRTTTAPNATSTSSATSTDGATSTSSMEPNQSQGSDNPVNPVPAEPQQSETSITSSMRQAIMDCLGQIDRRPLLHVEIAKYKATSDGVEEPVAVAVTTGDVSGVDVYVVPVHCSPSGLSALREHIKIQNK